MKILLMCLALFSMNVSADFYVGGSTGYSRNSDADINNLEKELNHPFDPQGFQVDDDLSSMLKGVFVGIQMTEWLAFEVDYARVLDGSISIAPREEVFFIDTYGFVGATVDVDRLGLSLVPSYKFNENWDFFGRAGYGYSEIHYKYKGTGTFSTPTDNEHDQEIGVLLGAGIKFHNEHHYVRLEAQRDFTGVNGIGSHRDGVILGFGYMF